MLEKSWLLRAAGSTGPSFRSPHRATFPWDRLPSPGQGTSYAANLDQLHEKETAEKSLVFQGWAGHAGEGGRQTGSRAEVCAGRGAWGLLLFSPAAPSTPVHPCPVPRALSPSTLPTRPPQGGPRWGSHCLPSHSDTLSSFSRGHSPRRLLFLSQSTPLWREQGWPLGEEP